MRVPNVADYELAENAVGLGVLAKRAFPASAVFCPMEFGPVRSQPWRHSIQIAFDEHAEPLPNFLRYLNHSCDPNLFIDVRAGQVITLRSIAVGEELTFFYPSTEWDMDRPFDCLCAEPSCIGNVAGAKYLPLETLNDYFINPHIQQLLSQSPLHRG